jgi:exosome complex component CSL4
MSSEEIIACFPGQRICASNENTIAGPGTYERLGYVHSSLAGIVETNKEYNVSFKHV